MDSSRSRHRCSACKLLGKLSEVEADSLRAEVRRVAEIGLKSLDRIKACWHRSTSSSFRRCSRAALRELGEQRLVLMHHRPLRTIQSAGRRGSAHLLTGGLARGETKAFSAPSASAEPVEPGSQQRLENSQFGKASPVGRNHCSRGCPAAGNEITINTVPTRSRYPFQLEATTGNPLPSPLRQPTETMVLSTKDKARSAAERTWRLSSSLTGSAPPIR